MLLNDQKHLRSVAEDLISNKQKGAKRIYHSPPQRLRVIDPLPRRAAKTIKTMRVLEASAEESANLSKTAKARTL